MLRDVLGDKDIDVADAEILMARSEAGLENCANFVEASIGMVDTWAGCVLVDEEGSCGLVDWEWFGLSDAANELGQFLGMFHINIMRTEYENDILARLHHFITNFIQNYLHHSPPLSLDFKRQVLLSHGRELIYSRSYLELDEATQKRTLEAGVRSLRAAGDLGDDIDWTLLDDTEMGPRSLFEIVRVMETRS